MPRGSASHVGYPVCSLPMSAGRPPPWESPSDDFFYRILDHVAHPVFVKDRSFRFVFLNRALCEMVGHSRDAMLGKTDYDFFPKAEADFFRAKDEEMLAAGADVVVEEEPMTDSRGARHVLCTTKVPLHGADGDITHVVGIIHDITSLKVAEDALRLSNENLERRVDERSRALASAQDSLHRRERLAVLGKLAGGVAHEIRNPLAAIRSAAHVVRRTTVTAADSDARAALDIIDEEIERADRIITDLIDYARVRPPTWRTVSAGYLIEQALGGQRVSESLRIERDLPDLPDVRVDVEQVQGALSNVVRNAIEAMRGAGTLAVSTRRERGAIVVSIADTGPGIAPDVRERLFEPLFTTKSRGLGLGLVTARALLENQGGSIACLDDDALGTTFELRLPLAAEPADE